MSGWEDLELALADGVAARLAARAAGPADGPLVVCVPGLSSNSRAFAAIGRRLAAGGRRVVALDMRGRGRSAPTPAGTYGIEGHARDVLAAGAALGAERFDVVGHSLGALIAMVASALGGERVRRIVLVDAAGRPEEAAMAMVRAGIERLGAVAPSADAYVGAVRAAGLASPWTADWEAHYRYELEDAPGGGVRTRTSRDAVFEDAAGIAGYAPEEVWPRVRAPALLVRAGRPIGDGFILGADDARRFAEEVPGAELVEVDANHFGVVAHDDTLDAVARFLAA